MTEAKTRPQAQALRGRCTLHNMHNDASLGALGWVLRAGHMEQESLSSRALHGSNTKKLFALQSELQLSSTIAFEPPFHRQKSLYISLLSVSPHFRVRKETLTARRSYTAHPRLRILYSTKRIIGKSRNTLVYIRDAPSSQPVNSQPFNTSVQFIVGLSQDISDCYWSAKSCGCIPTPSLALIARGVGKIAELPTGHGL